MGFCLSAIFVSVHNTMENGGQHTASVYKLESKTVGRLQDKLLTGTTVVGITACVSLCVQYRPTGPPIDVRCTTHGPFFARLQYKLYTLSIVVEYD